MNVVRSNITDRKKNRESHSAAVEPVGIISRNYNVFHVATAKRGETQAPSSSSSSSSALDVLNKINRDGFAFKAGSSNLASRAAKFLSSTTDKGSETSTAKWTNKASTSNSSTLPHSSSSSNSLMNSYPHLFRHVNKSNVLMKTPSTARTTSKQFSASKSSSSGRGQKTPGSTTVEKDPHPIIAITEGRGQARGEIGIASLDTTSPHLILCQISDTQSYCNTLTKINILNPVEIVLPHTFCGKGNEVKIYSVITEAFPMVTVSLIQRRHFNDSLGLQQIRNLCAPEYASVEMLVTHKFYALCAASALLKYVEYKLSMIFVAKSLKVEYQGPQDSTFIDVDSAQRLELVKSCRGHSPQHCLLGSLNHCCTAAGSRLLRATILEPPSSLDTILARQQCITEIVAKMEIVHDLQCVLYKVNHAERLLGLCMRVPQQDSLQAAETQLNQVLLLKTVLEQIPPLVTHLRSVHSPLLVGIKKHLENEQYKIILARILETVQDEAHAAKGYSAAHYQRCFAVRPNVNGLLDVARKTYSELIDDMIEIVKDLGENHGLPLELKFNATRGFHMQLSSSSKTKYKETDLHESFIQVQKKRNTLTFTTQQLIHIDERCKDVRNEIHIMSNVVIFSLLVDIRDHVSALYLLCENLALLDMLLSLAKVSALSNYVCPKFGDVLDVTASRHPILDFISPTEPVANDIFASRDANFSIITGPNMSGKSIYIRQVVLLQIMAQVGCYVPAKKATFRAADRIFARIGFDDSIECNASTFVHEAREVQYMMQTITPRSLAILDELCRGTSVEEGTAVAWAFSEKLLQGTAFIFLTTHFAQLTLLSRLYSNVYNYHFEVLDKEEGRVTEDNFVYTHRLLPGPSTRETYGLHLARVLGMPEQIVDRARQLFNELPSCKTAMKADESTLTVEEDRVAVVVVDELLKLLDSNELTVEKCLQVKEKYFSHAVEDTEDDLIISDSQPSSSDSSQELVRMEISYVSVPDTAEDSGSVIPEEHVDVEMASEGEMEVASQPTPTAPKDTSDNLNKACHTC